MKIYIIVYIILYIISVYRFTHLSHSFRIGFDGLGAYELSRNLILPKKNYKIKFYNFLLYVGVLRATLKMIKIY